MRREPPGDEFERLGVDAAAVVKRASLAVVERADVADVDPALELDLVAEVEGHLVHEPEDAATRRPRDMDVFGVESTENVARQALRAKLFLDGSDNVRTRRAQLGEADVYAKDGKQRVGVGDQQTLAPIDPEHVGVPVVVARRLFGQGDATPEQAEQLLCAPQYHRARA